MPSYADNVQHHSLNHHFPVLQLEAPCFALEDNKDVQDTIELQLEVTKQSSFFIGAFLYDLCKSVDLASQLFYLQNMDEDMQKLFHGTLFKNKILVAYVHIHTSVLHIRGHTGHTERACSDGANVMLSHYLRYVRYYSTNILC